MSENFDRHINYDNVAPTYDQRYAYYAGERRGVAGALLSLVHEVRAERILEVGCGTGHWLQVLRNVARGVYGVDRSLGMLKQAQASTGVTSLVRAHCNELPFRGCTFDLVFCVSALHHFDDPARFIRGSRSLIRPGGRLSVIGMDPHTGRDQWYLYDYFPGTYETDLKRYPSSGMLTDWMIAAGFDNVQWQVVERLVDTRIGKHVVDEPMLRKNATSQLTLLTDKEYEAGLKRIRTAVAESEALGKQRTFSVDISLAMVTGKINA